MQSAQRDAIEVKRPVPTTRPGMASVHVSSIFQHELDRSIVPGMSSLQLNKRSESYQSLPALSGEPWSGEEALRFELLHSDGGEYSQEYECENLLKNDYSCYCSATEKREGINVIAKFKDGDSCNLTHVEVRAPCEGYTSPLGQGMIFVSWDRPDVQATNKFNSMKSVAEFKQYVAFKQKNGGLAEDDPVLFFDLKDSFVVKSKLDVARSGRYVLIKLLRPRYGENIDVQYVGFHGWSGPRGFACGELI